MTLKEEKWNCIKHCGACCKLDPVARISALQALSKEQQDLYLSMAGQDGWCKYYDKSSHKCTIYKDRPFFCKVENLDKIFNISVKNKSTFAIKCCKEQIRDIYGGRSKVMKRYSLSIRSKY